MIRYSFYRCWNANCRAILAQPVYSKPLTACPSCGRSYSFPRWKLFTTKKGYHIDYYFRHAFDLGSLFGNGFGSQFVGIYANNRLIDHPLQNYVNDENKLFSKRHLSYLATL